MLIYMSNSHLIIRTPDYIISNGDMQITATVSMINKEKETLKTLKKLKKLIIDCENNAIYNCKKKLKKV
jgi:hypothetical protein